MLGRKNTGDSLEWKNEHLKTDPPPPEGNGWTDHVVCLTDLAEEASAMVSWEDAGNLRFSDVANLVPGTGQSRKMRLEFSASHRYPFCIIFGEIRNSAGALLFDHRNS